MLVFIQYNISSDIKNKIKIKSILFSKIILIDPLLTMLGGIAKSNILNIFQSQFLIRK